MSDIIETPSLLPGFRLLAKRGAGSTAEVFEAESLADGQHVLVKLAGAKDAETRAAFAAEWARCAALEHPHLPHAIVHGLTKDARPYIVFADHGAGALLDRLPVVDARTVVAIGVQVARALAGLHAEGLVHRDVSPANVLVAPNGHVWLIDLGLAAPIGELPAGQAGTPLFMAPEALDLTQPLDARADLYSLGALLYAMITGQAPFESAPAGLRLQALIEWPVPPLRSCVGELNPKLTDLLKRLLMKAPEDRPPSAQAVVEALLDVVPAGMTLPLGPGRWVEGPAWRQWQAHMGECGCFAFVGAQGSGRTRTLERAAASLRLAGHPVITLRAEGDSLPYGLAGRLWRVLLSGAPEACEALAANERGAIAALWPETLAAAPADAPDDFFRALTRAFEAMIAAQPAELPLAILLDDGDAADAASRDLLCGLASGGRVACHWLWAGLELPGGAEAFSLAPFAPEAIAGWLAGCIGHAVGPRWGAALAAASGGHPGTLADIVGELAAKGERFRSADPPEIAAPRGAEERFIERWERLADPQRELGWVLAVGDGGLERGDLGHLADLLPAGWEDALGSLVAAGILRAGPMLVFEQGWYGAWIRANWKPTASAPMSTAIADRFLEALGVSDWSAGDPTRLHQLARWYARGDRPATAVTFGLAAGRRMSAIFAHSAAIEHFDAALRALADLPPDAEATRARQALWAARADVQRRTGALDEACAAYEACLAGDAPSEQRVPWLISLGKTRQMLNRYEAACEALEHALALLAERPCDDDRLRALTTLGRVRYFQGDREASARCYEQALAVARQAEHAAFEAEALSFLGNLFTSDLGRPAEGLAYLEQALTLRTRLADRVGLNDTHMLLGNALAACGRFQAALGHFEANRTLSDELGLIQEAGFACLNIALCLAEQGSLTHAASVLADGRRAAERAADRFLLGLITCLGGLIRCQLGDRLGAESWLNEARQHEAALGSAYLRLFGLLCEAERHLFLGNTNSASRAAELATALVDAGTGPEYRGKALALLAEARLQVGELAAARTALDQLLSLTSDQPGPRARAMRLDAALLQAEGEAAHAHMRFAEARAACVAEGLWRDEVLCHLALAALAIVEGTGADPERALELAERVGAPDLIATCCLVLAADWHAHGRDRAAERLQRRGHALLARWNEDLPGQDARRNFLRHPDRRAIGLSQEAEESQRIRRQQRGLEMLLELGQTLGRHHAPEGILELTQAFTREITQAERSLVLLPSPEGWAAFGHPDAPFSRSIVHTVETTGEPVCVLDTRHDPATAGHMSVLDLGVRAVMCVPLRGSEGLTGLLYVDSRMALGSFGPDDLRTLEAIAAQAAVALDNARLQAALLAENARQQAYIERLEESEHVIQHLEEIDRLRGRYFQAASHDLRAPLAAIHANCQALERGLMGPLGPDQAEAVAAMRDRTRALTHLIDGLLDAAQIEAGKLVLHPRPVHLAKPVGEAVQLLAPLAEQQGIGLTLEVAPGLAPVRGDERRLAQIVLNLVGNAIKFTREGGVTVRLYPSEAAAVLEVADTGCGLSPERANAPFERFGASAASEVALGSGLGLWLVKGLVDLHEGEITVESRSGQGTTFRICLPRWELARESGNLPEVARSKGVLS